MEKEWLYGQQKNMDCDCDLILACVNAIVCRDLCTFTLSVPVSLSPWATVSFLEGISTEDDY